ncbi:Kelch repeat-containing protein [Terricaulis sp.]|uniref:Kelch repeat-containing protein n=1 Tax=Terricaulis sp. TaxID=2768686 RepID=UPI003783CF2C
MQGAASGDASWREGPRTPYAVQEIYPALHHAVIWIAGGFAPLAALGATHRTIGLDVAAGKWRDGPHLPTPSHHVQLASLNDELYAIGGFMGGENRRRWICTPRVLKLAGDAWVEAPSLPRPIAEGIALVHGGRIHLIGGRSPRGAANREWEDQIDVNDHFVFTPESGWEPAAPLPLARNSHAGVVLGDELHIISGRTVENGQTPAHHIYDSRTATWRNGTEFPEARGGIAAALWRDRIVAGGGEVFAPGSVGDTLYEFVDGAWQRLTTLPTPRHGHGFITAGGALYALGGSRRPSAGDTLSRVDVMR